MLFNSIAFLIFAPIFYLLYFGLRGRARLVWCLLASYVFYAWWDWRFVALLAGSTLVAFYSGQLIGRSGSVGGKRFWLWFCIGSHLLALGFFKYFTFLADSLQSFMHWLGANAHYKSPGILLPIGISFFTFTALSYVIDIYRGTIPVPEADLLVFATYECLFPHLVAGPILRASKFLPQLKLERPFDLAQVGRGLEMITWGYLLKLCLADNAAMFANVRFQQPGLFNSASLAVAVLAFAFQIYGDFAGYSLIAIGLARIMGYDFGVNFNRPYFAANFSEFWQRWHISLSSWIRDYLYVPLGGNRGSAARTATNLVVTMFLAGLWHGAGWNFIAWGLLQGGYLAVQRSVAGPYKACCAMLRCPPLVSRTLAIATVFVLTCVGWIFFRARGVEQATYILSSIFSWRATSQLSFGGMKYQLLRVCLLVGIVLLVDALSLRKGFSDWYQRHLYCRVVFAGLAVVLILFTGSFGSNSFIYFQF